MAFETNQILRKLRAQEDAEFMLQAELVVYLNPVRGNGSNESGNQWRKRGRVDRGIESALLSHRLHFSRIRVVANQAILASPANEASLGRQSPRGRIDCLLRCRFAEYGSRNLSIRQAFSVTQESQDLLR